MGVSISKLKRGWFHTRAWLFREVEKSRNPPVWILRGLLRGMGAVERRYRCGGWKWGTRMKRLI